MSIATGGEGPQGFALFASHATQAPGADSERLARPRASTIPSPAGGQRPKLKHFLHISSLVSVLVVMHHCGEQPLWFHGPIGLLRMPLFFFIAGFLLMHTNPVEGRFSYVAFLRKKVYRLLVPYLFFTSVAFPVKAMLQNHAIRRVTFTWHDYFMSLLDPSLNPVSFYWFLVALFVLFLIAPALRWALIRGGAALTLGITFATLLLRWYCAGLIPGVPNHLPQVLALQPAAYHLFYVWMGMVAWKYRDRWNRSLYPFLAAFGVVVVAAYYFAFRQNPGFVRFSVVLLGFYSIYCLADIYVKRGWTFLRAVDGNTYQIYLLAWFPQQFVLVVLHSMWHWDFPLCAVLMFSSGLLLPLLIKHWVDRYMPAAAFLLGFQASNRVAATAQTPVLPQVAFNSPS